MKVSKARSRPPQTSKRESFAAIIYGYSHKVLAANYCCEHCVKYCNFTYFLRVKILCKGRVWEEFWAFPHQEIRWNYHILRSESFPSYKFVEVLVTLLYIEINAIIFSKFIRETSWKETFDKKFFFSLWIWIGLLKHLENA